MRLLLTLAAVLFTGLVVGLGSGSASAGPLPALSTPSLDTTAVETVGWRERYYRRTGVWPTGPRNDPLAGNAVAEDVIVTPSGEVVVVPLRPLSCGEYRYWNGVACVDARYTDPYLGPK